jgi:hypothetical protein
MRRVSFAQLQLKIVGIDRIWELINNISFSLIGASKRPFQLAFVQGGCVGPCETCYLNFNLYPGLCPVPGVKA